MRVIKIITIDKVELESTVANINQKLGVAVNATEIEGDAEIGYSSDLYANEI